MTITRKDLEEFVEQVNLLPYKKEGAPGWDTPFRIGMFEMLDLMMPLVEALEKIKRYHVVIAEEALAQLEEKIKEKR